VRALPALIAVNILVFFAWIGANGLFLTGSPDALQAMQDNFVVSSELVLQGRVWTLLTSEFSHNWFAHLFFNMFALWVFGRDVERVVGPRGFLHLYLAGGILASLGHVLYGVVMGTTVPALGASGAVMAVAVVSAFLFPNRVLLLFFVIPLPQFVAVGLFLLIDVAGMVSPQGDMIAHAAHLGGALYGWFYYRRHLRGYLEERLRELGLREPGHHVWTHPPA
jgi:membrane associated rhomboid family serine protease